MLPITRRTLLTGGALLFTRQTASGKGYRFQTEPVLFADELTEREVWRLTDPAYLNHLPHYHHRFLSRNNDFLLLASEVTGDRQIFVLRLRDGRMTQMTQGPGVHPYSPILGPRDRWFLAVQANVLKQISVGNGRERRLYRCQSGWEFTGDLAMTSDGRYSALIEMQAGDRVTGFARQYENKPRCRLRVVENRSGKAWVAVESDDWLAHPQFQPGGTQILYSHEGPWHRVDARLRLVDLQGEQPRNLLPRQGTEGVGHEFWSTDGSRVYFLHYPDESGRGATVRELDISTGAQRTVSRCTRYGWVQANDDNSVFVGASRSLAGPNIYLLFAKLQREITVCEHASGGDGLAGDDAASACASWPEPVFSRDSQWVYFVSDKDGKPAIYRTDVSDLVAKT